MLNVTDEIKNEFKTDNYHGVFTIVIGNTTYDSHSINSGSLEITESVCSEDSISFSCVEKNSFKVSLINFEGDFKALVGQKLTATQNVLGTQIPLGTYIIQSSDNDGDYIVDIEAYDNMVLFDKEVTDWWNKQVTFPITARDLLISLCKYVGIEYDIPATYTNSDFSIDKNAYIDEVTGAEFLGYLQEISACFFKADRSGVLKMIQFPTEVSFENIDKAARYGVHETVSNLEIADYKVAKVTKLQIKSSDEDVGIILGKGDNTYVIEANPLLYGLNQSQLESLFSSDSLYPGSLVYPRRSTNSVQIFEVLNNIEYVPFSATVKAYPYVECGDMIEITSFEGKKAYGPLLSRTMKGAGLSDDEVTVSGTEQQSTVRALNRTTQVLKQKSHELVLSVDQFKSAITEIQTDLSVVQDDLVTKYYTREQTQSIIDQTKDAITSSVSNQINTIQSNAIKSTVNYYLQNNGETPSINDPKWSTTQPTWIDGKHIWLKVISTRLDGTTSVANPVDLTGSTGAAGQDGAPGRDGQDGAPGKDGQDGAPGRDGTNGIGITSVTPQYYQSTSYINPPGPDVGWTTTQPTYKEGQYIWVRYDTLLDNKTHSYSTPVLDQNLNDVYEVISTTKSEILQTTDSITSRVEQTEQSVKTLSSSVSEIKQTSSELSLSVEKVQHDVDNLNIANTNILTGTRDLFGWRYFPDEKNVISTIIDGFNVFSPGSSTNYPSLTSPKIESLKPNTQYTLSYMAYGSRCEIEASFTNGTVKEGTSSIATPDSTYKKYTYTFTTADSLPSKINLALYVNPTSDLFEVGIYAPKIELGVVATEWAPSYDDNKEYVKKAEITLAINNNTSGIKISADKIDMTGVVTFINNGGYFVTDNDLQTTNATIINGSNIRTGSINADLIKTGTLNADLVTVKSSSSSQSIYLKNGVIETQNNNGYRGISMFGQTMYFYSWKQNGNFVGFVGVGETDSAQFMEVAADSGDYIALSRKIANSNLYNDIIECAPDGTVRIDYVTPDGNTKSNRLYLNADKFELYVPNCSVRSTSGGFVHITQKFNGLFYGGPAVTGISDNHLIAMGWDGSRIHIYVDTLDVKQI